MKKIAFHSNHLNLRGIEVNLYNYAKYNEEILGNKSIIFVHPTSDLTSLSKFKERFEVNILDWENEKSYIEQNNFDYFYVSKMGIRDKYLIESVPTIVHAVFRFNNPHGYKYLYISDWLATDQGYDPEMYSLPYICEKLPSPEYDLREKLSLDSSKTVFGYYGGNDSFDIPFVKNEVIPRIVKDRNDIVFIFMNIDKFIDHPNVLFLKGSYNLYEKSSFVNACDAMLHARFRGETFGLAVAEFSQENKPVITYSDSSEKCHIDILGDKSILYSDGFSLYNILNNLEDYIHHNDYYEPYLKFSPKIIINKFKTFIR